MRPLALVLILFAAATLPGCLVDDGLPGPVDVVAGMEMQVNPSPVDWRGDPRADGIEVQIRLYREKPVQAVTVTGTLELLLYQGVVPARKIAQLKPLRTWSFSGAPLRKHARPDMTGCHYVLQLDWGTEAPPAGDLTIIARYRPPEGRWLYSEPNSSIVITPN